jgi:type II secretory pathway pseudopilin PulG
MNSHRTGRPGLTLLEVIVSVAIFWMAIIAIAGLVNLATTRTILAELKQEAVLLCQSKINEFASGVETLGSADGNFEEDPDWHWSADASEDNTIAGLWTITVTVSRDQPPVSIGMTRKIQDPTTRGNTMDSSSTSSSSSSSGSSSSATGTGG